MEQLTCACGKAYWVEVNDPYPDEDCPDCKKARIAYLRDVNGNKKKKQNLFLVGDDFKLFINRKL
jgi:hypothetical protein